MTNRINRAEKKRELIEQAKEILSKKNSADHEEENSPDKILDFAKEPDKVFDFIKE